MKTKSFKRKRFLVKGKTFLFCNVKVPGRIRDREKGRERENRVESDLVFTVFNIVTPGNRGR